MGSNFKIKSEVSDGERGCVFVFKHAVLLVPFFSPLHRKVQRGASISQLGGIGGMLYIEIKCSSVPCLYCYIASLVVTP